MSKKFGDMRQLAFVVRNIDDAMHYWTQTLGVGPFFIKRRITFADFHFRGKLSPSPVVSIALAHSGVMQIELLQQHDDTPSIYKEFLDNRPEGLQHVSSWMSTADMRQRKAQLLAQGVTLAQECRIPSSGVNLAYFSTEAGPGGFIFEIADLLEPHHYERVLGIAEAAEKWDGHAPIREVST